MSVLCFRIYTIFVLTSHTYTLNISAFLTVTRSIAYLQFLCWHLLHLYLYITVWGLVVERLLLRFHIRKPFWLLQEVLHIFRCLCLYLSQCFNSPQFLPICTLAFEDSILFDRLLLWGQTAYFCLSKFYFSDTPCIYKYE